MLTINKDSKNENEFDSMVEGEKMIDHFGNEPLQLEVTGKGKLVITNTGGSSASEGGMGSGSDDDREKGSLTKPGEKSGSGSLNDDSDTAFDPIKKNVKEAAKEAEKE